MRLDGVKQLWSEGLQGRLNFPILYTCGFSYRLGCSGLSAGEGVEEPYLGIPLEQLFWVIVKTSPRTLPQLSWGELRKRSFRILWNPMELLSKQTYNKDTCTDMSTSSEEVQERPGRIKPQGKVLQKLTLFCISNFILHYFMIFFLQASALTMWRTRVCLFSKVPCILTPSFLPHLPLASHPPPHSSSPSDIQLKFCLLPDALIWHPPLLSAPFSELQ